MKVRAFYVTLYNVNVKYVGFVDRDKQSKTALFVREVETMYFVYELIDPQTDATGYVGITNNPNARYQQHLQGKDSNDRKNAWLQQLLAEKVTPKMNILEIVDDKKLALERETYWIRHLIQQGVPLTNAGKTKKTQMSDYYTASETEEVLGVDYSVFATLRHRGLITPAIPGKGSRGGYYSKRDIDKLAADLDAFRGRHGSEKLNAVWFKKKG